MRHRFAAILSQAMSARILVVDDEPDLLELVRFNLSQAGFRVETAASERRSCSSASRPEAAVSTRNPAWLRLNRTSSSRSGSSSTTKIRALIVRDKIAASSCLTPPTFAVRKRLRGIVTQPFRFRHSWLA